MGDPILTLKYDNPHYGDHPLWKSQDNLDFSGHTGMEGLIREDI